MTTQMDHMGLGSTMLSALPTRLGGGLIGGQVAVNMQPPRSATATPFASRGTLADGTYCYVLTALNGIDSPWDAGIINSGGGGAGRVQISWVNPNGSAGARIYGRGAWAGNTGSQNKDRFFTAGAGTTSFSDTGGAGTPGTPPRRDRESGNAPVVRFSAEGDNFIGGSRLLGIGTLSPAAKLDVQASSATTVGQIIRLAASPAASAWEIRDSSNAVRAQVDNNFNLIAPQLVSSVSSGTAPLVVASSTEVANLNTQLWRGRQAVDFSGTLDFPSIAPQTCSELTIGAPGAGVNGTVAPAWPATIEAGLTGIMFISAADTARVRLCNVIAGAINPSNQTFAGRVIQ